MLNLPGSRKECNENVQKTLKSMIKKSKKQQRNKQQLINNDKTNNFKGIISKFVDETLSNNNDNNYDNNHSIRILLSSLKSLKINADEEEEKEIIDVNMIVKCCNQLQKIYCCDNSAQLPETIILSSFCLPFILLNYLRINYRMKCENIEKLSLKVYLNIFGKKICDDDDEFEKMVQNEIDSNEFDQFENVRKQFNNIIEEKNINSFTQLTLYYSILNCTLFFKILISDFVEIFFIDYSRNLIQLCLMERSFHAYRLLNQFLKLLYENQKIIEQNLMTSARCLTVHHEHFVNIFNQIINIIDNEWETPINGIGLIMKENYQFILKYLVDTNLIDKNQINELLLQKELKNTIDLPFTSKAKYKKLTIITEILSQKKNLDFKLLSGEPYGMTENFNAEIFKHLSISSLTTCIGEYYKSTILYIMSLDEVAVEKWSKCWLQPLVQLFKSDQIKSMIVHNTLMSSILPKTLELIPESMNLLMQQLNDCPYGQVCLIRLYLEKQSFISNYSYQLPTIDWLFSILNHEDDMIRIEGLALLTEEKFIKKNRIVVCKIFHQFLCNNMNIDSSSFRQRMIRIFECFVYKIITCLCDCYGSRMTDEESRIDVNDDHKQLIEFLTKVMKLSSISLLPGSSFQRKYTALNLIAAILTIIKNGDNHNIIIHRLLNANNSLQETIPIRFMLIFGIIDKDDKIRRLCEEILIQYTKIFSFTNTGSDIYNLYDKNQLKRLSNHYQKSFRHQECHIGGLLFKYLLMINLENDKNQTNLSNIIELIENVRKLFYSNMFRENLLHSSQTIPLHGWLLSLNQCMNFQIFQYLLSIDDNSKNNVSEHYSSLLMNISNEIIQPAIKICLDALDFFMDILTPEDYDNDDEIDEMYSPSFEDMSKSIKQIIHRNESDSNKGNNNSTEDDFTSTNEFQLIQSMCWLNMKESCFLLANCAQLSADLLNFMLINDNDTDADFNSYLLIPPEKLNECIRCMIQLMLRCRHRGVIEACSVSLSKFIRSFLRINYYTKQINNTKYNDTISALQTSMRAFVKELSNVISVCEEQSKSTSITRRSAGLALIIQSILIGEVESYQKDRIKFIDNNKHRTLYDQFIESFIRISQLPINDDDYKLLINDLPQSNAMHVLRSIMNTSILSQLNYKTAADLFPICLNGFSNKNWQIRNSSLQLFGSCVTRLLGQKKRTKQLVSDDYDMNNNDIDATEESTITMIEFYSRYPNLLRLIREHIYTDDYAKHRSEIVPVLALLALFTPFSMDNHSNENESDFTSIKNQLKESLIEYIRKNRCWKIRMLASKSLTNMSSFKEMDEFFEESFNYKEITLNHYHGLLFCAKYMIELNRNHYHGKLHEQFLKLNENIKFNNLKQIFQSIFHQKNIIQYANTIDENKNDYPEIDENNSDNLNEILLKISFENSDDIRMIGAKQIIEWFRRNLQSENKNFDIKTLKMISQIVLTLLEDEDRSIRFEMLKINQILNVESNLSLSINLTIDSYIKWLLQSNTCGHQALFELILSRFEQSIEYIENYPLIYQKNKLLFEKEEKNVYAEPAIMNTRLVCYFSEYSINNHDKIVLQDHTLNEFKKILGKFQKQYEINEKYKNYRNEILFKGIWQLPKYFQFLIDHTLLLRIVPFIQLSNDDENHNHNYATQLQIINDNNPFYLKELIEQFQFKNDEISVD